jgi:hypothetical protein
MASGRGPGTGYGATDLACRYDKRRRQIRQADGAAWGRRRLGLVGMKSMYGIEVATLGGTAKAVV